MRLETKAVLKLLLVTLLLPWPFFGCGSETESGPRQSTNGVEPAVAAPGDLRIREPAVAGLFYPADAATLSKTIADLLAEAPTQNIPRLKALICPHAGYSYSGATAACGYKLLEGRDIRTVIVMGPSHYASFTGVSLPDADYYQTPLGVVAISGKAKQLAGTGPFKVEPPGTVERPSWWAQSRKLAPALDADTPETWEHSVEVQVPFLQVTLKNFQLVPMIFGNVDPQQVAGALAGKLDDRTLIVASSDLSHYHRYADAKGLDNGCIEAILNLDIDRMKTQEACGKGPILALMCLAREKGWKAQLLDSRNSGDVTGDKGQVVGYAAIAFYQPVSDGYGPAERKFLLALARTTLARVATNGSLPAIDRSEVPARLAENKACFVTLTEHGELRGCIGHLVPQEPLYQAIADNARNAALRDPRFLPVQPDEVNRIKIEISVLSDPQPLRFNSPEDLLGKLQPYNDGVVLRIGSRSATFLPQVWEQLPDKVAFLNRLSEKAGCPASAWRGKDTAVSIYHVEAFDESE
ncbi:MAG TPA: AmmeMemoRadiSam system protein B [Verrucomicrobiae bacterium]|nr:AmmeMemoRadiSam system protein B [Verrucomicrobiae bacterium]